MARKRMECPVAQLLGIAGDGCDVRIVVVVEADQLADQRGVFGAALAQDGADPVGELGLGRQLRVAVEDFEASRQHVAHQAIRQMVAVGLRSALIEADVVREQLEPLRELEAEPALADARLADDGNDSELLVFARGLERFGDARQLGVAPDHRGLDAFEAAVGHPECARLGADDEVAAHRPGDALDLDRRLRRDPRTRRAPG